jgi:hypothetical protein
LLLAKLLTRLILAGCLLLQVVAPVWACQQTGDTQCHHCCHDAGPGDNAEELAPICSHCMGHGQTWTVVAAPAGAVTVDDPDRWRPSRVIALPPVFPDTLFKPPIIAASA